MGHGLIITSDGIAKFRPNDVPDAVTITLAQPLGHDETFLNVYGFTAGFKLKLTLNLPVDTGNGAVENTDILDINISDLVPEDIHFDKNVVVTCKTLTPPEPKWIKKQPARRPRVAVRK